MAVASAEYTVESTVGVEWQMAIATAQMRREGRCKSDVLVTASSPPHNCSSREHSECGKLCWHVLTCAVVRFFESDRMRCTCLCCAQLYPVNLTVSRERDHDFEHIGNV